MYHALRCVLVPAVAAACAAVNPYSASRHGGAYMFNYYIPSAPGTTPWAPCWSPDGRWIAVGMQGSIWTVDPESGVATEVAVGRGYASSPAWSPDGRWIAYSDDWSGKRIQLRIVNLETREIRALTDDEHLYLDLAFSPDGGKLAYVSTLPNGYFNVYVRPIRDGRWDGPPVAVTSDNEYPRDRLYFGKWDMHTQPAWTPDGRDLVLVSNRGVPLGSGDLWRVPARENGMREATAILREQTLYRTRPHVSPDGRRIVYSSTAGAADEFSHLYVVPTAGGAPYKLTFGRFDDFHPRWSPDARRIAFVSNEEGLPQLCVLDVDGGARKKVRIAGRLWSRPMGKLHVRVVDGATRKVTYARIHGLAEDGKFYAPTDTYTRIGVNGRDYFHTSGEFTMEAPPGRMTIEAVKGYEYEPARLEVEIQQGAETTATLTLRRIANLRAGGWFNGPTHVHMNYGGNLKNTPENLAMMAAAEDVNVVCSLVANKDNRVLDREYFRPGGGEYPVGNAPRGVRLLFGQEYRPAFWGHSFLLGLREHLISPFAGNYEGTAIDSLYPPNADMFRKAKAQGGVVGYVHPFGDVDPLEGSGIGGTKAFPVDAALGTVDAQEWSGTGRGGLEVWRRLLNNDIALVPVGGEDSITDLHRIRTLGAVRTFVHVDREFSAAAWLDGLRKGRTFVSSGPLVEFRVNGKLPGESLRLPAAGGEVTLEAAVTSIAPLSKVAIHHRLGVLREIPLEASRKSARFRGTVRVADSDWLALVAEGPAFPSLDADSMLAITNAVRVYVGERKIRDRASAEYFLGWIERLKKEVAEWPWWNTQGEKDHVFGQIEEARRVYERLAAEARR